MNKETLGNKIERIITEQDKYNWRKEMEFDFEDAKENGTAYVNDFYAARIR